MTSAASALQSAIVAVLKADSRLLMLIGSPRIYDRAPRDAALPYIVVASVRSADWSTGTEPGQEHRLVFHVWTRGGGRRQASDIADALREALDDRRPGVAGHHVVGLQHESTDMPPRDGETWQAICRFRAVTEPVV